MAPCSSNSNARRPLRSRGWLAAALGALALVAHACDKVPLLAPSGSAITLSSAATAASSTDAVQITALVLEGAAGATPTTGTATNTAGAGQPVHNGTHVTFTSNIGHVDPADATTINGKVTVTFFGDGQTGKATITATSGAAIKTVDITLSVPAPNAGGA